MNVTLIATLIYPGGPTLAAVISIVLHRNQWRKLGEKLDATFDHLGEKLDSKIDALQNQQNADTQRTSRRNIQA